MGALALLVAWAIYRYTDLLEQVPFSRALDWLAEKAAGVVQQPWASGMTGALIVAAIPAVVIALLMGLGVFISWPISVAVLVLCMGPVRLFELSALGESVGIDSVQPSQGAEAYHRLAARDVVGSVFWAAVLGAPGAVFYRAARELAESPAQSLSGNAELLHNGRVLFGFLFWLPARIYAMAQLACGSGGRLERMLEFSTDTSNADAVITAACGDRDAALASGPNSMLMAVAVIAAVAFFV